jgi:hypothetical protein
MKNTYGIWSKLCFIKNNNNMMFAQIPPYRVVLVQVYGICILVSGKINSIKRRTFKI